MDDIKRRSQNSRSRGINRAPMIKAHERELYRKVEEFESDQYQTEDEDVDDNLELGTRGDIRSFYTKKHDEPTKIKISRKSFFFIIVLLITALAVTLWSFVFNRAYVSITPRVYSFTIDTEMNSTSSIVGYISTSTLSTTKTLPKSDKKKVQSKAAGTITVYNNYSESTQKLVKNTRFESPNGMIFRISDSIVIPGKVSDKPGSVNVRVTADSFGESYNIKPSKFTIPGFKNSPRFTAFYAESVTDMTGGADGEKSIVSLDAIALADTSMQNSLKTDLNKQILNLDLPVGYFMATNTIYFEYTNNLPAYESGTDTEYKVTANAYYLLINKNTFAEKVAKNVLSNYNKDQMYTISDINEININPKTNFAKDRMVAVKGKGMLVYNVDYEKVKTSLINKKQDEYSKILSNFSAIEKADISLSPFWTKTFPSTESKIKTIELLP